METPITTIGFDKNGCADFGVNGSIQSLTYEGMQHLRAIIPVAIGIAENMWRDEQSKKPGMTASENKPSPLLTPSYTK